MDDADNDIQRRSNGAPDGGDRATLWQGEHLHPEGLSEYLDGAGLLRASERDAVRAHLADCAECRAVLSDLQAVVASLAALPLPVLPRSFALTPDMLEERDLPQQLEVGQKPIDMLATPAWRRRQIALTRYASVVAAVLLVLVLGIDLLTGGSENADQAAFNVPEAFQQTSSSAPAPPQEPGERNAAPAEGDATPPATEDAPAASAEPTPAAAAGAAEDAAATEATDDVALSTAPDEDKDGKEPSTTPADEVTVAPSTDAQRSEPDMLRLLQFGLALGLAWLLAALVLLPRISPRR